MFIFLPKQRMSKKQKNDNFIFIKHDIQLEISETSCTINVSSGCDVLSIIQIAVIVFVL